MATRVAYGTGSGVQDAVTSCATMRHRMAAAIGWSRFETLKAMDLTTTQLRQGIYVLLRQGPGQLSMIAVESGEPR